MTCLLISSAAIVDQLHTITRYQKNVTHRNPTTTIATFSFTTQTSLVKTTSTTPAVISTKAKSKRCALPTDFCENKDF